MSLKSRNAKIRDPLAKRLPKQLRSEFSKYLIIFLFVAGTIAFVSGWNVAGNSMSTAYDNAYEKYNIEDGNFDLFAKADDALLKSLGEETDSICENFYAERKTEEIDSTLRMFAKRGEMNLECLMDGEFPAEDDEVAIDRLYAVNNELSIGDKLTLGGDKYTISGFVALTDYSALFSDNSDMMFDAMKFGVGVITADALEKYEATGTDFHYVYSWRYSSRPDDDKEAKELSEDLLETLGKAAAENGNAVTGFIPGYVNQAIIFTGDDIKGDRTFINMFLYIVVVIIAFIFALITSTTITEEASVIGTLRATGYTKSELIRHYMTLPMAVIFFAAVVGNILGYTVFKNIAAAMYYNSYSLTTYVTLWNGKAFFSTTVMPLAIMALINFVMLSRKLSLSPLRFLRHDLSSKKNKKAFRLNTKLPIMHRFRLRVVFQNLPNYITVFFGALLANALLLFGMMFVPLLDNFQERITTNMLAPRQYILKAPAETDEPTAEKFCAATLKATDEGFVEEDISIYGISEDSRYIDAELDGETEPHPSVYLSVAYAEKRHVSAGDEITLHEQFGDKEYTFTVEGVYDYPAALAVFMSREAFCEVFETEADYYNGYFSEKKLDDIDGKLIAAEITRDDLTKTSRQLKLSMGSMMDIFLIFGVAMFMMMVYLLSKIIIDKNAQSVSMTKILGYTNSEINRIYVLTTTIVVILSLLITIPVSDISIGAVFDVMFAEYPGWLPYYIAPQVLAKMAVLGVVSYLVVAAVLNGRVKKIPMSDALKNTE